MLKYSVIGTSWITKSFIDGANLYEGLSLDGVYSRSFEKGKSSGDSGAHGGICYGHAAKE